MPKSSILIYREEDGVIPFGRWLVAVQQRNDAAFQKCLYLLKLLEEFGSELRRPRADYLRDGVYELRTEVRGVNFRILYGFVGKDILLVTQGLTKKKQVPNKEIELAIERLENYRRMPNIHGAAWEK